MKMPNINRLAQALSHLTEGLQPGPKTKAADLEAIRFALASDLKRRSERELPAARRASSVLAETSAAAAWSTFFKASPQTAALRSVTGDSKVRVERRTELDLGPLVRGDESAFGRGMASGRRVGPFIDLHGGNVWFDLFEPAAKWRIMAGGGTRPEMILTSGRLPRLPSRNYRIDLEPGTVWVRARLVASAAPADAYLGFAVRDGSLTLPSAPAVSGDMVTMAGAPAWRLVLDLALGPAFDPATAACVGSNLTPPARLIFALSKAGLSVSGVKGGAEVHGTAFEFEDDGAPSFDAALDRVLLGCEVEPARWDLGGIDHELASISGNTAVAPGGWSIPVTRISDPMSLAEADPSASAWLLRLDGTMVASWLGGPAEKVEISAANVLVGARGFAFISRAEGTETEALRHRFELWPTTPSDRPLRLEVRLAIPLDWNFVCDAIEGEGVLFNGRCAAVLDRPISAVAQPIPVLPQNVRILLHRKADVTNALVVRTGTPEATQLTTVRLALENAYISTQLPFLFGFTGTTADGRRLTDGALGLHFNVLEWVPTLPDPYAGNVRLSRQQPDRATAGWLAATITWALETDTKLAFTGLLGISGTVSSASVKETRPSRGAGTSLFAEPTAGRSEGAGSEREKELAAARRREIVQARHRTAQAEAKNRELEERLSRAVRETMGPEGGPFMLLDVSTRRHQIGVQFGAASQRLDVVVSSGGLLSVRGMGVEAPIAAMRVFTVPAIQWEPVRTLDADQKLDLIGFFPTPLASATDGGATVIGSRSMRLAPVIPELALDTMVKEFEAGTRLGMVTTLPFGLKAALNLRPGPTGGRAPDSVGYNRKRFKTTEPLEGAIQLIVQAESGAVRPGAESPSFEGATAQLLNGVDLQSGSPLGISVLGATFGSEDSVESMFNREFADERQRVPLTRLDVSGYGSSTFSDWQNPFGAFAEATKVEFRLMVGRTALEIVKVASVIYPWGIRATRSVTIERRGGGGVIRRDSGWHAQTPGVFDFRWKDKDKDPQIQNPEYLFHPGLLRGLFNVTRIRASDRAPVEFANPADPTKPFLVSPVFFDAEARIDGLDGFAPTRGVLGFLHLSPVGKPLSIDALAALITQQSAIGGPVDAMLNVGGSGFRTRALRIEVDVAREGAEARFVGVVRGTPVFGPSGAWSVVRFPGAAAPSAPLDMSVVDAGSPLIRTGAIANLTDESPNPFPDTAPAQGDTRFSDPADLFREPSPANDYAFLQTTPTHAFLYRQPRIENGKPKIISKLTPYFADTFARCTAATLFPPLENAIELVDPDGRAYELVVNAANGRFRLTPAVQSGPVSLRPDLQVSADPLSLTRFVYSGATLHLEILEDRWSMQMPGFVVWSGFASVPEMTGMRALIKGSTEQRAMLDDIETLINPVVETALEFLPGMKPRDNPAPTELGASNLKGTNKVELYCYFPKFEFKLPGVDSKFKFKASVKFFFGRDVKIGDELELLEQMPQNVIAPEGYLVSGSKFVIEIEVHIPGTPPGWFGHFGLDFETKGKAYITGPKAGKGTGDIEVKAFAGIGVGLNFFLGKASLKLGAGIIIRRKDYEWNFGGLVLLEGELELKCEIVITVTGELIGLLKPGHMLAWEGEVAINVKFFLITLEKTWEVEGEKRLKLF